MANTSTDAHSTPADRAPEPPPADPSPAGSPGPDHPAADPPAADSPAADSPAPGTVSPETDTVVAPATSPTPDAADPEAAGGTTSLRAVLWTVLWDVVVPFSVYLGLSALGVPAVAALAVAGGVALLRAIVIWIRAREVSALSILLVVRFTLGVGAAVITGEARLVLAKDSLVTGVMGIAVLVTLLLAKPFIYYIRRSLSPHRAQWEHWWATSSSFRSVHRQMTWVWGLGLITEAGVRLVVIYTTPLDVAALVSQALAALAILTLVTWTQWFGRRVSTEPDVPTAPAVPA